MKRFIICLAILFFMICLAGYQEATRIPVVRRAHLTFESWPQGSPPLRLLLMSDAHVQGPDMPPERLARIVRIAEALRPDLVVIAGDFLGHKSLATRNYTISEAVRPFADLHAPMGTYAVLGNNDRTDGPVAVRRALTEAGIKVLENDAVEIGPIALGGFRTRFGRTLRRLRSLPGTRILVAHSPDAFATLPSDIPLMLAGHTHCGQIVLPVVGALSTGSRFGDRYRCGLIREKGKLLVVTGGLGTSRLPIRIGAPPDIWLLEISGRGSGTQRPRPAIG